MQRSARARHVRQAEYFESWIQGFRRRKLRGLFGHEEEVLYCNDSAHSQQNRCLVSGRRLMPAADSGGAQAHGAFFALLEAQFAKYAATLPIDLRARGLVSSRYGHDGTALVGAPADGRGDEPA